MEFEFEDGTTLNVEGKTSDGWNVNGDSVVSDLIQISDKEFHIRKAGVSYRVLVENLDHEARLITLSINGKRISFRGKDRYEELLKSLGMNNLSSTKAKDLKAPMPGLVIGIEIVAGQEVKTGDKLFILEAMKMENVIKSAADGVVKEVLVNPSDSVEKGQILVTFEN